MKNTYILMIMQALLLMLLFFSEGYVKYTTIGLFLLIDLVLFLNLLTKKWSFEELLTFAAVFCSGIFLMLFIFAKSTMTLVLGIALTLLFLIIAMIDLLGIPLSRDRLVKPRAPEYIYKVEYEPYHDVDNNKRPEPVMHVRAKKSSSNDKVHSKLAAKAVAYELEREAHELKNAERLVRDMETYNAEKELSMEAKELMKVQRQINEINRIQKLQAKKVQAKPVAKKVVVKKPVKVQPVKKVEAKPTVTKTVTVTKTEIKPASAKVVPVKVSTRKPKRKKARRTTHRSSLGMKLYAVRDRNGRFKDIQRYSRAHAMDIKRKSKAEIEAAAIKNKKSKAEQSKSEKLKFLDQQEQLVKQARALAKAQKDINSLNAKQSAPKTVTKVVKAQEESFYFATENGNKFHEPGCMSIKDVPKNKLTLYVGKKDAMKKGLQPCGTCIPK